MKSRREEAEDQISDLVYKVAENNESEHQKEKKNFKKWGQFKVPLEKHQEEQLLHQRGTRKRRERARD